ncbi:hypothetical protein A4D02_34870 [Niastella koreensis]|uniref:Kinase n=2 Tax=Niastella koreensis TaxID=354356 RepID=G8TJB6_NIAKG|nr:ATP-binding protein [Niastella koreensis]AEV98649.1 hypothetical protein Niako_2304 [Niastella koreensis GR20-10]OQP44409.1 hypothetical protein A4D02_34870 [Niastella koreensis]
MVILVTGLPGCGKSYFAEKLATAIRADYINSDRVRKTMFPIRTYSTKEKLSVYDEMLKKMQQAMQEKKDIVLDATFYSDDIRKKFSGEAGNSVSVIEVQADETLIKERLQQKRTDSEADFKVYHLIKTQWEPISDKHLILQSNNKNIKEMLQTAFNYLHLKNDERTN